MTKRLKTEFRGQVTDVGWGVTHFRGQERREVSAQIAIRLERVGSEEEAERRLAALKKGILGKACTVFIT